MSWHAVADEFTGDEPESGEKVLPDEKTVTVYLLEELPDGTLRVGNSHEVGIVEAKSLIEAKQAKAHEHAIGVVPEVFPHPGKAEKVRPAAPLDALRSDAAKPVWS